MAKKKASNDKKLKLDETKPAPRRRPKGAKGTAGKYSNGEAPYQPTEKEQEERVQFAKKVWLEGRYKTAMLHKIADEFGTSTRTAQKYLSLARDRLAEQTATSWQEKREEAYNRYLAIATDESMPPNARIKAQTRIDQIFGLDAPVKIARTDADGKDISVDEARDSLASLLDSLAHRSGSDADGESAEGPEGV